MRMAEAKEKEKKRMTERKRRKVMSFKGMVSRAKREKNNVP